jgi:2-dehydro-3-deoxyphosphogluconate aldolase/(4S)-4-hydroxy-2-oxoglutarate aldolase
MCTALEHDLTALKFFPAEILGGLRMLQALSAPFPEVRFLPTGGVKAAHLADYLRIPGVLACGGSWIVEPGLVAARDAMEISRRAREAAAIVQRSRRGREADEW